MRTAAGTSLALLLLTLLGTLAAASPCSAEKKKEYYCNVCHNTGKVKTKFPEEYKNLPFRSSVVVEYKTGCCGLGWVPCPNKRCPKRAAAIEEFKRLTEPLKTWLKERRKAVEGKAFAKDPKLAKVRAMHAETDHFYLAGTFKKRVVKYLYKGMVKKKIYDPPHSLHLYARRIEDVYRRFLKLISWKGGDYRPHYTDKWLIMIWEKKEQQAAASFAFCNFTNEAGASVEAVLYTTWDDADDLYLHHKIVNAIACLMTEDYGGVVERFPVWFKEAIAHWIEYDVFGELRIFNAGEVDFNPNCPTRKLKSAIKKELKKKRSRRIKPLVEFINHNIMDLTGWERLKGWSLVDWMLNGYGKDSVSRLILSFKKNYPETKNQIPSFREVFDGMRLDEIDEAWREWVLETYPDEEDD